MLPENEHIREMLLNVLRLPTVDDVREIYAEHGVKAEPDPMPQNKAQLLDWWTRQMTRVKTDIQSGPLGLRYQIPRCPVCSAPMRRVPKKLGKRDTGLRCEFNHHHYLLEIMAGQTTLAVYAAKSWLKFTQKESAK